MTAWTSLTNAQMQYLHAVPLTRLYCQIAPNYYEYADKKISYC